MGRALLLVLIVFMFILGVACSPASPDVYERPTDWYSPINPKIALENLVWCYNNAAYYDRYETLIHDDFIFYFSEHDRDNGLPATYNKTEELEVALGLFENEQIGPENIDLDLYLPEDYLPPADDETIDNISHVTYDLSVTLDHIQVTYHAQHTASFELTRQDDADSDEARWWISKWWDEYNDSRSSGYLGAVEEVTWGQIKAL